MDNGETDYVRRDLWDPMADVRAIAARARLSLPLPERPAPETPRRRSARRASAGPAPVEPPPFTEPGPQAAPPPPEPEPPPAPAPVEARDPFTVLGVAQGCSAEELKKAFRGLVVLYHPDKVAHLGHEFQELAERKTRELTVAYDAAQRIVEGAKAEGAPDVAGDAPGKDPAR